MQVDLLMDFWDYVVAAAQVVAAVGTVGAVVFAAIQVKHANERTAIEHARATAAEEREQLRADQIVRQSLEEFASKVYHYAIPTGDYAMRLSAGLEPAFHGATVQVTVVNDGTAPIFGVTVWPEGRLIFHAMPGTTPRISIGILGPGESETLSMKFTDRFDKDLRPARPPVSLAFDDVKGRSWVRTSAGQLYLDTDENCPKAPVAI